MVEFSTVGAFAKSVPVVGALEMMVSSLGFVADMIFLPKIATTSGFDVQICLYWPVGMRLPLIKE